MGGFLIPIGIQHFDDNGDPLNGGLLYSFAAGTSTPLAIYSDQGLTTPISNPAVLNASGRLIAFVQDGIAYKFTLKTSAGVVISGYPIDNVSIPDIAAPAAAAEVPTGSFLPTGKSAADTGYLLCDGSAVSRTTFAALFAAIGTSYGVGNGSTTFNVPDFRGRFLLGKSASGTGSTLGATGGNIDHVHTGPSHTHGPSALTIASSGAHTHVTGAPNEAAAAGIQAGSGGVAAANPHTHNIASSGAHTHAVTGTTDASGTANTGTANPPYGTCNWQVKT